MLSRSSGQESEARAAPTRHTRAREDAAALTAHTILKRAFFFKCSPRKRIASEREMESACSARRTELQRIRHLRRVSSSGDDECAICQEPFGAALSTVTIPSGAFECCHAVCYDCNLKLLTMAATTIDGLLLLPSCRAWRDEELTSLAQSS